MVATAAPDGLAPTGAVFFKVKIDDCDLGSFVSCSGLSFEVKIEQREEGGNQGFLHQLPGGIKYSNVKFTRPLNADSAKIAQWFAGMASQVKRTTAEITALAPNGAEVTTWRLTGVIPVRWSGPEFSVESAKPALETFEIAHHGFLPG